MKTFGEFVEMYERKLGARKGVDKKKPKEYTCNNCGVDVKSKDKLMKLGSQNLCADCGRIWHELRHEDSED